MAIHLHFGRRQAFGESNALLECLGNFFVIQSVAGRIDQSASIGDGDAAPRVQQLDEVRSAAFAGGSVALRPDGPAVREKLVRGFNFLLAPARANFPLGLLGCQRFVARQEFLHLHHIVGQRLGGGVDCRKPPADNHNRHADLEIRHGVALRRAG